MLGAVLIIVVSVVAVFAFAWWAERHWNQVDSYYEREYQEPPIFAVGSRLGGGQIL